ncbi:hypothetical protein WJX72_000095 [[Myrmecia] bisecta]|uniref:Uncharacterized protein n=1 Tax=[Myrmecia] bisecta TaxID=41462 RepID=A0AAW1Q6W1_9CHLO
MASSAYVSEEKKAATGVAADTQGASCGPGADFFGCLAAPATITWAGRSSKVTPAGCLLCIPVTVVFQEYTRNTFYTDRSGQVCQDDTLSVDAILQKLCGRRGVKATALIAVAKLPAGTAGRHCNEAWLLRKLDVRALLEKSWDGGTLCVQQLVRCLSLHATLYRAAWQPGYSPARVQIISNKARKAPAEREASVCNREADPAGTRALNARLHYLTTAQEPTLVRTYSVAGPAWQPLHDLTLQIARHVEMHSQPRVAFKQLVCDFVQNECGHWVFLQVKAVQLLGVQRQPISRPMSAATSTSVKAVRGCSTRPGTRCMGDYCLSYHPVDDMGDSHTRPSTHRTGNQQDLTKQAPPSFEAEFSANSPCQSRPATSSSSTELQGRAFMIAYKHIIEDREEAALMGRWLARVPGTRRWQFLPEQESRLLERGAAEGASMIRLPANQSADLDNGVKYTNHNKAERVPIKRDPPFGGEMSCKPSRRVQVTKRDRLAQVYYRPVSVCGTCYRVYLRKAQQRHQAEEE